LNAEWAKLALYVMGICFSLVAPVFAKAQVTNVNSVEMALDGPSPRLFLKNKAPQHSLEQLDIQLENKELAFKLEGSATCARRRSKTLLKTTGVFLERVTFDLGPADDQYWTIAVFENRDVSLNHYNGGGQIIAPVRIFDQTAYQLKPLDVFQKKAVRALRAKDRGFEFFKKDQTFKLEIPVRIEAICRVYTQNRTRKKTDRGTRYSVIKTKMIPLRVTYKGDARLTRRLAPKLKNSGSVKRPSKPVLGGLALIGIKILQAPKNLRDSCPFAANFRIEVKGRGDGWIKVAVSDGTQRVHDSKRLRFRGGASYQFSLPVVKGTDEQLYQPQSHALKIEVTGVRKSGAARNMFGPRVKATPFYWQHSCISR